MKSKRDTSFLIAGHVPFNLCEGRPPSLESYLFFHRWTPFTITHIGLPEYQHAVLINGALISCGELSRRIETLFLTGSETLLCTGISDPLSSFNSNVPSSKIVSVASTFAILSPPFCLISNSFYHNEYWVFMHPLSFSQALLLRPSRSNVAPRLCSLILH